MSKEETIPTLNLQPLARLVQKKFLVLIVIAMLGGLAGWLISKSITPLYESFVVLYPSNSNSRSKQLEDFSFGMEIHSERLMQLLASSSLLDSLDARYNLVEHYGIDRSKKDWYDSFLQIVKKRIDYHKTRYVSVVVSVQDHDPEMAATIANASAELVNIINANIVKEGAKNSLEAVKDEFERRQRQILGMNDSLVDLRGSVFGQSVHQLQKDIAQRDAKIKQMRLELDQIRQNYKIYDFGYQINVLNEHLAEAESNFLQEDGNLNILVNEKDVRDSTISNLKARREGALSRKKFFKAELDNLVKVNAKYASLNATLEEEINLQKNAKSELQRLDYEIEPQVKTQRIRLLEQDFEFDQIQLQSLREQYQKALSNYLEPVPMAYVISEARPSYKKIYPYTMVNILIGAFGTGLFAMFLFAWMERQKQSQ